MANWFDPLRADLQIRLKSFEDLRDAEHEKRLVEELAPIAGFIRQNQLDAARLTLEKVSRILPTNVSRNLEQLFSENRLLVSLAEIEAKFLSNSSNRRVLETVRIQLLDLEHQSQRYSLPNVTTKIIALRRRVDETNVGINSVQGTSYFSTLNITTFGIIFLLVLLTAYPLLDLIFNVSITDNAKSEEILSWWYSLHPEMLGALITFVLLNVIFDSGRRTQERKQRQYSYYLKLLYTDSVDQKQEIINEMKRERLLTEADLRGVDWNGVNLCNVNLRHANLRNGQNIDKALFDGATILPNGRRFNPRDPIIENMKNFI